MNIIKARLSIVPTDTKQEDFVLALVDYLDKEFKNNHLNSKKNNSYVKVCLSNKYEDKFDSVIVDCCNGRMYLRGNGCRDKYFGRLSKFVKNRVSDAYHCVNYNAKRIINRINKLEQGFREKEVVSKAMLDLRGKKLIAQERKTAIDLRSVKMVASVCELNKSKTAILSKNNKGYIYLKASVLKSKDVRIFDLRTPEKPMLIKRDVLDLREMTASIKKKRDVLDLRTESLIKKAKKAIDGAINAVSNLFKNNRVADLRVRK